MPLAVTLAAKALGERYEFVRRLPQADERSEQWLAVGRNTRYLIKLWPFADEEPDDVIRALWDAELRTLYRISSSRPPTIPFLFCGTLALTSACGRS